MANPVVVTKLSAATVVANAVVVTAMSAAAVVASNPVVITQMSIKSVVATNPAVITEMSAKSVVLTNPVVITKITATSVLLTNPVVITKMSAVSVPLNAAPTITLDQSTVYPGTIVGATAGDTDSGTVDLGVHTLNAPSSSEFSAFASTAGKTPRVLMWYRNLNQAFLASQFATIDAIGALPMLTLEPWDGTGPVNAAYDLGDIIAGTYDAAFTSYAVALKAYGKRVYLRFAHEMNGNWYPWCEGVNGNTSGQYVTAWRRVWNLFAAAGCTNVRWVWAPNVEYSGSTALAGLYPGDAYVDVVAVDGYNWGTSQAGKTWQTPSQVFDSSLNAVKAIAPTKPLWIAEVACSEVGGDKAAWIASLWSYLRSRGDVGLAVWFNLNKETDWRLESSSAASAASQASVKGVSFALSGSNPLPQVTGVGATRHFIAPLLTVDATMTMTVTDSEGAAASANVLVKDSLFYVVDSTGAYVPCYVNTGA